MTAALCPTSRHGGPKTANLHRRPTARRRPELLLRRLTSAIWGRNGPELAAMFTTRCREGCRGYVPTPVAPVGSYKLARWIPDPRRRGLMITLAYLAQSHGHIRRVELTPMKARILPGQVHLRARLRGKRQ